VTELAGVVAAVVSSALGGTAAAVTRYVIGATDAVTLAAFRFGIGVILILPIALLLRRRWPHGRDWVGVALLGVFFFSIFFVIYNVAMSLTTAARGSLALCTLPLVRTTPTRVANTMTVNPVAASLLAAVLVGEPIGPNLLIGIVAIAGGIWIASTDRRFARARIAR
jgi:drug/metabolite transporter (DMT)-like permease